MSILLFLNEDAYFLGPCQPVTHPPDNTSSRPEGLHVSSVCLLYPRTESVCCHKHETCITRTALESAWAVGGNERSSSGMSPLIRHPP
ncbi:hypothetical protein LIA77_09600 [Sarocladium implicatum]|nr:hypothetical protein LIA77_09600 [Sarocladium implicatum]